MELIIPWAKALSGKFDTEFKKVLNESNAMELDWK
jgi:hypothetical protein